MLTPQQIQDISFEKALFGGYDMDSVDDRGLCYPL